MSQPGSPPYDPNDPYRYGRPDWQSPPSMSKQPSGARPTGKDIANASWQLLKQDRELLWLPILSVATGLLAALILFVPGFLIGRSVADRNDVGGYVGGVLAAFALSIVTIYFQAALVIGANMRADGQDPTFGEVMARAWQMRGRIVAWAVVTTTVGMIIRAIEQRLGVAGRIVGFLGGIAWAIATFFAVPVLVAEDVGPIDAVKRSAAIIRQTWGTSVRTTVRLGLLYLLVYVPFIALFVGGMAAFGNNQLALGIVLTVVAVVGFVVISAVYSAITTYARALIYRYAVGRTVPGMSPQLLAGAFTVKGR